MTPPTGASSALRLATSQPETTIQSATELALHERLMGIDPSRIVMFADCDLTLANKHDEPFHDIELTPEQYECLRTVAGVFALTVVLTARGEESTIQGLFGQRPAFDLVLASNCGHHVLHSTLNLDAKRDYLPIGSMPEDDAKAINESIKLFIDSVGKHFAFSSGKLILDPRELCGAVVYEACECEEEAEALRTMVNSLWENMDDTTRQTMMIAQKHPVVNGKHCGYFDIKPHGMDKGDSLRNMIALQNIKSRLPQDAVLIIAGDSAPDLKMMAEAERQFGADNVINVWVGDDIAVNTADVLQIQNIYQLPGSQWQAIPAFYRLLDTAAAPVTYPRPVA